MNSQTTTFDYDAENQLIAITYPDETTNLFAYNGAGDRVSSCPGRRTNRASVTETFSYDGDDSSGLRSHSMT